MKVKVEMRVLIMIKIQANLPPQVSLLKFLAVNGGTGDYFLSGAINLRMMMLRIRRSNFHEDQMTQKSFIT